VRFLGEARVDRALATPELIQRLAFRRAPVAEAANAAAIADAGVLSTITAEQLTAISPAFSAVQLGQVDLHIPLLVLPGHRMWSGSIAVPVARAGQRLRLVVREVEVLRSDREAVGSHDPERSSPAARRIVYLETIEL
jgi:hypothetical protein